MGETVEILQQQNELLELINYRLDMIMGFLLVFFCIIIFILLCKLLNKIFA